MKDVKRIIVTILLMIGIQIYQMEMAAYWESLDGNLNFIYVVVYFGYLAILLACQIVFWVFGKKMKTKGKGIAFYKFCFCVISPIYYFVSFVFPMFGISIF